MGCMLPNYFSNVKSRNAKNKMILKEEHDLEQCAHILEKRGQSHL
jgi:hypothetical protein